MPFFSATFMLVLLVQLTAAGTRGNSFAPRPFANQLVARQSETVPPARTIQVPIDHFSNDSRTYSNRYWVNDTYYNGGPVFLLDIGEEYVTQDLIDIFLNEATAVSSGMELVRQFHGLAVLWEHRFYGESLPFPLDPKTGIAPDGFAAYQYLTIDQALEDAVYLAKNFKPVGLDGHWSSLHPTSTPWIFIGGSYPGMRAAWSRIRSPEVWFASWASSAPVQTQLDMESFYLTFATDFTSNCTADIHSAVTYVDKTLRTGSDEEIAFVKLSLALASDPSLLSNATAGQYSNDQLIQLATNLTAEDTSYLLLNIFPPSLQNYGFDSAMLPYCTYLEQYPSSSPKTSDSLLDRINTTLNNPQTGPILPAGVTSRSDALTAFKATASTILKIQTDFVAQLSLLNSIQGTSQSWNWQACSQIGWAQVANASSPINVVSTFLNLTSWLGGCRTLFPYDELPPVPDTLAGLKYGGWNMQPSNVMFTNGLKDPWHTLSVQSTTQAYGPPMRNTTAKVPRCGQPPDGNDVFGLVYPGGWHIGDLSKEFGAANTTADQGVACFASALKEWLPCFQQGTGGK